MANNDVLDTPSVSPVFTENKFTGNPKVFRAGTELEGRSVEFVFTDGGLGDYICWLSAIEYIAKEEPHVEGRLHVVPWFFELAHHFMKLFLPKWKVFNGYTEVDPKKPIYQPWRKPINATGANLVDLGYLYFVSQTIPPEGYGFYPKARIEELDWPDFAIPENYIAIIPGATNPLRKYSPETFNAITEGVRRMNLTPVFLGTPSFGQRKIEHDTSYDFSKGINLIGKTHLTQALKIMGNAKAVVGWDGGLLHLAATTSVPIVYGYTITDPAHRRPRRRVGKTIDVHADPAKLSCLFCQDKMRHLFTHSFTKCYYGDAKCTDLVSVSQWMDSIRAAVR